ncbi:peptidoglycan editing factor PgeF [Aquabacterium sp. J223]|uniref:peptidoglycan editing factor PgeF n=1 Tax=Aquabacterium sp. J223 TaxID=2898431 RepID=UPI0021AE0D25|nr:peptidoglycan editing factor PgeF [Aquabacterium sp. J223]UUX97603.1 peptidoglycan editing factor PgeF [Aquabacterium sp. J223]
MPPDPAPAWDAADLLEGWPALPGVGAAMTDRRGGASTGPWSGFNLGDHVGDAPAAVAANRDALQRHLGVRPVWLRQVHGRDVLRLAHADAEAGAPAPLADAAVTAERGLACAILVADCLPVLFADVHGRAVGAAHAGWRGLAGGVLEATVQALCGLTGGTASQLRAWLGPCIGPAAFEVGEDVLQAFGAAGDGSSAGRFTPQGRRDGRARWTADLAGLAHDRLRACGVHDVSACGRCTVQDPVQGGLRFFSFRRDGVTGRMAALVWRR